ncbi:1,4-dihydroxy-2-naphthoate polyprenyltransferase [Lacticaseibacillus sp. GG6-2]
MATFLELVEARTKLASLLPCAIGVLFAAVYFNHIDGINTVLFVIATLLVDMATTAINNLMDYHKAQSQRYLAETNIISKAGLDSRRVVALIVAMLSVASVIGLVLVWRTQWLLLFIGGACFVIGIFYTFGPLPLSRLPLGEVFSGVTMGLGIPFIAVFVNVPATSFVSAQWAWPQLYVSGNWVALVALGLVCVTPMATIANVMLANNLSDLDEDHANHRTTLPMYLGHKYAIWLYQALAYCGFLAIMVAVGIGLMNWPLLLALVAIPGVVHNTRLFVARQVKTATFKTAIANLVLANGALVLGLLVDWRWPT